MAPIEKESGVCASAIHKTSKKKGGDFPASQQHSDTPPPTCPMRSDRAKVVLRFFKHAFQWTRVGARERSWCGWRVQLGVLRSSDRDVKCACRATTQHNKSQDGTRHKVACGG